MRGTQKRNGQDGLEMKTEAARESHGLWRAHSEATGTDTRGAWEMVRTWVNGPEWRD